MIPFDTQINFILFEIPKKNMQSKLPQTGTTIFTIMSSLAAATGAINLSQGFPNFSIDNKLKNYVIDALDQDQVQYAPMPGRLDLRQQIASKIANQHSLTINPDTEITITAGATQAIFTAVAALIATGDEVILFDPAYDCYDPSIRLFGGKPIHLKLSFPNYTIDWAELERTITSKTKLIIFNNPQNPAGSAWLEEDLKSLEKITAKFPHLYIISDEVYEHLQYTGIHQSVLKSDLLRSRSFVTYSFGKTFHVTGWKIGYCIAPPEFTKEFRKVHQFNVFCVNNSMQFALAKYLELHDEWKQLSSFYQAKRDLFQKAMTSSNFKPLTCQGTYFCLYDYSAISAEKDTDFAIRLTKEIGVATIPVSVFYSDFTDHKVIRICFAKTDELLLQAAKKLCKI